MGFRFICQHCEHEKFFVYWDITQRGMLDESAINLKCAKCGTEFALQPELQWRMLDFSHATVCALDDKGNVIEIPMHKASTIIQEDKT